MKYQTFSFILLLVLNFNIAQAKAHLMKCQIINQQGEIQKTLKSFGRTYHNNFKAFKVGKNGQVDIRWRVRSKLEISLFRNKWFPFMPPIMPLLKKTTLHRDNDGLIRGEMELGPILPDQKIRCEESVDS